MRVFRFSVVLFTLAAAGASLLHLARANEPAGSHGFVLANDNNPEGNSVTAMALQRNGALAAKAKLATGGLGALGGFVLNHGILVTSNGHCIFASDAGSSDVAAFEQTSLDPPAYTLKGRFAGPSSIYGIELAMDFHQHWLYTGYTTTFQLAVWSINSDCSLGSGGAPNFLYAMPSGIGDMTALQNSSALLVTFAALGEVSSFTIHKDGSLTLNSTGQSVGYPTGIIANATSTYAVTTSISVLEDAVDVWPINANGSLQQPTHYNFASQSKSASASGITWDNGADPHYIYVANNSESFEGVPNSVMILTWTEPVPTFKSVFMPKGSPELLGVFSKSVPIGPQNTTLVYLAEGEPNQVGVFEQGDGTLRELSTSPSPEPNATLLQAIFAYPYPVNYQ